MKRRNNNRIKLFIYAAFIAAATSAAPAAAFANCVSPPGVGGRIVFNGDDMRLRYCNGADWIDFPKAPVNGGPDWTSASETKVVSLDNGTGDNFGIDVAVQGHTALIGAEGANSAAGSVYVFTRHGDGMWGQSAQLFASDGEAPDRFGGSVALDSDVALIGARNDDDKGSNAGAAYVFTGSADNWNENAKLTASDGVASDGFGTSVAVSGETAIVGAPGAAGLAGAAYIFTRAGGAWSEVTKLAASDGAAGAGFGASVALDGDVAVVGALGAGDVGYSSAGAAYVFVHSGGTWSETQKLTAPDGEENDNFGLSVAIASGNILVGAPFDDDIASDSGAAWVFRQSGGVWSPVQKLTASDGNTLHRFGYGVALSGDTALIGAWGHTGGRGAVYVFGRAGNVWNQTAELGAFDGAGSDRFGRRLDVSQDTVLVGAYFDDDNGSQSGSAYFYIGETRCENPSAPAAGLVFNADHRVLQWCDGSAWHAVGPIDPGGPNAGCSDPPGAGGAVVFNRGQCLLQYCDGGAWWGIGAPDPAACVPADCTGLGDSAYNDTATGHCYFYVNTAVDQPTAQAACEAAGGYLAVPTSAAEDTLISAHFDVYGDYWIGLDDAAAEGEWRYSYGELAGVQFWSGGAGGAAVGGRYVNWHSGEPNNDTDPGGEQCAIKNWQGSGWTDYPCTSLMQEYVCEKSGSP